MGLTDAQIVEKAKETKYNHQNWFKEGTKSVYDAISYYAKTGDFFLDFSSRIQHVNQLNGYKGSSNRKDIVEWLIKTKQYEMLIIRYNGKEKGTDRGKLKIQTYLLLKGYKNVD